MKRRIPLTPDELLAIAGLVGLVVGLTLVAGFGWALVAASVLILAYAMLPDQRGTT